MAVTLKDYLDRPLESYCSEILDEWRNLSRIDVPVLTTCMYFVLVQLKLGGMARSVVLHAALLCISSLLMDAEQMWNGV